MKMGKSAASLLLVVSVMASCFTTIVYAAENDGETSAAINSVVDEQMDVLEQSTSVDAFEPESESVLPDESVPPTPDSLASPAAAQVQIPSSVASPTTSNTGNASAQESNKESVPQFSEGQEGFVERLYYYVLGRKAGKSEINYYVEQLSDHTSNPSIVASCFLQSPEFAGKNTTDTEYIYILYRAILGRDPDSSGLSYYLDSLSSGSSRDGIFRSFLGSPEFEWVCNEFGLEPGSIDGEGLEAANSAAAQFVRRLYRVVLGRSNPGQDEILGWADVINQGKGAANVVYDFFNSAEYKNKNTSNEDYVEALYATILNRGSDKSGKRYYVEELEAGVPRNAVLSGFIYSPEFAGLCASYGLNAGSMPELAAHERNPGVAMFVQRQFKLILGRTNGAGPDELESRVTQLINGYSVAQQTYMLFSSAEFTNRKLTNEQYIEVLYNTLLGRSSDSGGMKYYLNDFKNGASRSYVLQCFLYSEEFNKICADYGLTVGTADITDIVVPSPGNGNSNSGNNTNSGETLTVRYNGQNVTGSVEDILVKTVYAEVGGFRNTELYKAQAVAAYTYIKYYNSRGSIPILPLVEPPAAYSNSVYSAVRDVMGQTLTYNGSLAQTTYYAMSNGKTNSAKDIWKSNVAYLVSVDSSYDKEVSDFQKTVTLTKAQLQAKLEKIYGAGICDGKEFKDWITVTGRNSAGYVTGIEVCGRKPSVEYFYQTIIGLRSPSFSVSFSGDKVTFTTQGYGHGVGMSQWGAYYYATKAGWNYQQILAHYYPGTELKK